MKPKATRQICALRAQSEKPEGEKSGYIMFFSVVEGIDPHRKEQMLLLTVGECHQLFVSSARACRQGLFVYDGDVQA